MKSDYWRTVVIDWPECGFLAPFLAVNTAQNDHQQCLHGVGSKQLYGLFLFFS